MSKKITFDEPDVLADVMEEGPPTPKIYTVGTLSYTLRGLVTLFVWLLLGDFCYFLMECVLRLLPLTLKDVRASNVLMALILSSIPSAMNMLVNPVVSTASDRHRGNYGRRIPFLLWATPFVTLFLIVIGYSSQIGGWLHAIGLGHIAHVSANTVTLVLICVFMVFFQFFNMVVSSIYYYLYADVVPEEVLGRFISLFRVVSAAAVIVWNAVIFKYAGTHRSEIYLGISLLYFVAFTLMCLKVKEGRYPSPPEEAQGPGTVSQIKSYFRECFSTPFFVWFFLISALWGFSESAGFVQLLYLRDTVRLSYAQIGNVSAWCGLINIPVLIALGWLLDRFHPIRGYAVGLVLSCLVSFAGFWVIHDSNSWLIYSVAVLLTYGLFLLAQQPLLVMIFPKSRYGQFCSAQAVANSIMLILGATLAGFFMDYVKDYRYMFIWGGAFKVLTIIPMVVVYYAWRRNGGAPNME